MKKCNSLIKVVELFAGVGGFRLGLEGWNGKSSLSGYTKPIKKQYEIVWSNQWEPSTKIQHASNIYTQQFGGDNHSNSDIATVDVSKIPQHDLLVGGFPCQDYSVAKQLSKSQGIEGKKGVLWWSIRDIVANAEVKPKFLLLENVDRLLKSPATQRGRDFAIILASLADLGYNVEWRVINAADYGMPQRRRRIFIFAFLDSLGFLERMRTPSEWILKTGLFAKSFPISIEPVRFDLFSTPEDSAIKEFDIDGSLVDITNNFNKKTGRVSIFENSGLMSNRKVWTLKGTPKYQGNNITLGDILISSNDVPDEYYLKEKDIDKWVYLKGSKKEERKKNNGDIFYYVEGPMSFPDSLDKPARTIITSEGGSTPSRFKHVIQQNNRYRRLVPVELERANMFPDNHTLSSKDSKRAFFMGNALVVGIIEKLGSTLVDFNL
jgi:DNA (cytosine-5)-methyltransferase 1